MDPNQVVTIPVNFYGYLLNSLQTNQSTDNSEEVLGLKQTIRNLQGEIEDLKASVSKREKILRYLCKYCEKHNQYYSEQYNDCFICRESMGRRVKRRR